MKGVIVACLYPVSNSGPENTYKQAENKLQLDLWHKIFHLEDTGYE